MKKLETGKIIGIYLIRNAITNKTYIGIADDIYNRWKDHIRDLNSGKHHNRHLIAAWKKYGSENFKFSILEICELCQLNQKEKLWIKFYAKGNRSENTYNLTDGGEGSWGWEPTPETKEKIKKANTGKPSQFKGKKHSDEAKKKLSIARTGFKESEEVRRKKAERMKGKKYGLGSHRSDEYKQQKSKELEGNTFHRGVKPKRKTSSKFVGVNYRKEWDSWESRIRTKENKLIYLGSYKYEEYAALAYNLKSVELYEEKAVVNQIDNVTPEMCEEVYKEMKRVEDKERNPKYKSKYNGVTLDDRWKTPRWKGRITDPDGNRVFLGQFDTEIEAAKAVNEALLEYYGWKAQDKLNIIPQSEISSLWSDCYDPTNSLP